MSHCDWDSSRDWQKLSHSFGCLKVNGDIFCKKSVKQMDESHGKL